MTLIKRRIAKTSCLFVVVFLCAAPLYSASSEVAVSSEQDNKKLTSPTFRVVEYYHIRDDSRGKPTTFNDYCEVFCDNVPYLKVGGEFPCVKHGGEFSYQNQLIEFLTLKDKVCTILNEETMKSVVEFFKEVKESAKKYANATRDHSAERYYSCDHQKMEELRKSNQAAEASMLKSGYKLVVEHINTSNALQNPQKH